MEFKWSLHSRRVINIQIFQAMRLAGMPNGVDVNREKRDPETEALAL